MVLLQIPASKGYNQDELREELTSWQLNNGYQSYLSTESLLRCTKLIENRTPVNPLPMLPLGEAIATVNSIRENASLRKAQKLLDAYTWPYTDATFQVRQRFRKLAGEIFPSTTKQYSAALVAANPLKSCFDVWMEECRKFSFEKLQELMMSGIEPTWVTERVNGEEATTEETFAMYLARVQETFTKYNPNGDGDAFQYFLLSVFPVCFKSTLISVLPCINQKLDVLEIKYFILEYNGSFEAERKVWNETKVAETKAAETKAAQEKAAQEKAAQEKAAQEKAAQAKVSLKPGLPPSVELEKSSDLFPCSTRNGVQILVTGDISQLRNLKDSPEVTILTNKKSYYSRKRGTYTIPVKDVDGRSMNLDFRVHFVETVSDEPGSFSGLTCVTLVDGIETVESQEGKKYAKRSGKAAPQGVPAYYGHFPELQLSNSLSL